MTRRQTEIRADNRSRFNSISRFSNNECHSKPIPRDNWRDPDSRQRFTIQKLRSFRKFSFALSFFSNEERKNNKNRKNNNIESFRDNNSARRELGNSLEITAFLRARNSIEGASKIFSSIFRYRRKKTRYDYYLWLRIIYNM